MPRDDIQYHIDFLWNLSSRALPAIDSVIDTVRNYAYTLNLSLNFVLPQDNLLLSHFEILGYYKLY